MRWMALLLIPLLLCGAATAALLVLGLLGVRRVLEDRERARPPRPGDVAPVVEVPEEG